MEILKFKYKYFKLYIVFILIMAQQQQLNEQGQRKTDQLKRNAVDPHVSILYHLI